MPETHLGHNGSMGWESLKYGSTCPKTDEYRSKNIAEYRSQNRTNMGPKTDKYGSKTDQYGSKMDQYTVAQKTVPMFGYFEVIRLYHNKPWDIIYSKKKICHSTSSWLGYQSWIM